MFQNQKKLKNEDREGQIREHKEKAKIEKRKMEITELGTIKA